METILTDINDSSKIDVYYQDEVKIDVDLSLLYIQSGQKEINSYVEDVSKPEIKTYIEKYAKPVVSGVVDQIATPVVSEYIEETVKPNIDEYTNKKLNAYNSNAMDKQALVDAGLSATIAQAEIATIKASEASNSALVAKNNQSAAASYANQASNSATLVAQIADSINPDQFVKNTGNQTVDGTKTFTDAIIRTGVLSGGGTVLAKLSDNDGKGFIQNVAYYTGNKVYNRLFAKNNTANKHAYIDITVGDDGTGYIAPGGDATISMRAVTPSASDNSTNIATTAWVTSKVYTIFSPNYASPSATVSSGGTWAANSTYNVPSRGYVIISSVGSSGQVKVNGVVVGQVDTSGGSGWTSPVGNVFLPVKGGDKITTTGDLNNCYFYFWAI